MEPDLRLRDYQHPISIPFLVVPMEDELLHSICVRWHILIGNCSTAASTEWLFGYRSGYPSWDAPAGLSRLEIVSGGVVKASEATLRERTILKAYLPLLPANRFVKAVNSCLMTSSLLLAKTRTGLATNTDSVGFLRLCLTCTNEQIQKQGFSYWQTTHQLPGNWICSKHKSTLSFFVKQRTKNVKWELPEHCLGRAIQPQLDVAGTLKLVKVRDVIAWLCSKESVDPVVLHAMVKLRLRMAGLCRSEIKLLTIEVEHISRLISEHYKTINTPDMAELAKSNWFQNVYSESRHYNPLTWAMAIAFVGEVRSSELEFQYNDAINRKPQRDLFDPSWCGTKRARAPTILYQAFNAAQRKQDAIERSGLSESEVDGWLRRDAALGKHWRDTLCAQRHAKAVKGISDYIKSNPKCRRVDVLKNCQQAYRWLETNDGECLHRLLPDVLPKFARQMTLDLDY